MNASIIRAETTLPESSPSARQPLHLFINCAPGILTDHESNGEGLIVYALANGLAERGNHVWVLAGRVALNKATHPNLHVEATGSHRIPFNSFAPTEYMARADAYLQNLLRREKIDLVWRIYGGCTPRPPRTFGRPFALGPIQYSWPAFDAAVHAATGGLPRFGVGLGALADYLYARGNLAAEAKADLLLYETEPHAESMRARYPRAVLASIPLIVRVPEEVGASAARTLRAGGSRAALRLLFAANLYPHKRGAVFCQTVGALRKGHGIEVEGIVLGDGPERSALEALCRDTPEIGDAVQFRGQVPNDAVFAEVAQADFFVSTSIGEPYGRSIVEAMAMGTPPVCHRSGGPGDYIQHNQTGLLIDTMDPNAFADAIAELSRDSAHWAEVSANARNQARTEWTQDAVLTRLENLFNRVCEK